ASWGQVTCWWSQSMVNISAVYPPERACGGLADSSGPSRVMPRARASSNSSAKVYPESTTCSPGGQPGSLQHVVDGLGHRRAGHGRLGGGDAGDQVRGLAGAVGLRLLAGLADVDPIARPALAALLGVASIRVIGGDKLESARRDAMLAGLPPDHLLPVLISAAVVLLHPDHPQSPDCGQFAQPARRARGAHGLQQVVAVPAVLLGELAAGGLAGGQAQGIDPLPVDLLPGGVDDACQPVRGSGG